MKFLSQELKAGVDADFRRVNRIGGGTIGIVIVRKTSYKNKCFLSGFARITSLSPPRFWATCTSFSAVKNKYIYYIF